MPSYKFEDLVNRAKAKGLTTNTRESMEWYRTHIRKLRPTENALMRENKELLVNAWTNTGIGKFYMFYYDPKWKDELPYYDLFPLCIPIHYYKDGFLGLNLHYLPPALRIKLLGALYDLENNATIPENKKLKVTYGILKGAAKYRWFKPCVKRYLASHIRSRFVRVPHDAWDMACFLPMERFVKADKKQVWKDSRDIINGV